MIKRASLRDVAKAAGVSMSTVSNYLNRSAPVHLETQRRIQEVIEELGYRRNEIASSLRRDRTRTLGMIVPSVLNPFYMGVFMGAEQEARRHGYTITLGTTQFDFARIDSYLDIFQRKQMDGILIEGSASISPEFLPYRSDIPVVVIEPPAPLQWSTVLIDNRQATHELVAHLVALGHTRIAGLMSFEDSLRCQFIKQALMAHDLDVTPDLFAYTGMYNEDFADQGMAAMRELLERRAAGVDFTACIVDNDLMAMGALAVTKAAGYRIPEDIAFTGFDNLPLAALLDPPLTTIAQPMQDMGRVGVEILLRHLNSAQPVEPTHVVLEHRLIARRSTLGKDAPME